MKNSNKFLGHAGMSMVQVLISVGLMGVVAVGMLRINENSQKASNSVSQNFEALQVITQAETALRDKTSCLATFGGGTKKLTDNFTEIVDRQGRVIVKEGVEYSGMGAGGKIKVTNIDFDKDGGGVLNITNTIGPFDYNYGTPASPDMRRVFTVTLNIAVEIDRSVNSSDPNKPMSFGGKTVRKQLRGFKFIVETTDNASPNGNIIGCHTSGDQYVEAACAALGGVVNPATGKCDNLNINQINVAGNATVVGDVNGGSVNSSSNVTAATALSVANCGGISRGGGPGGKVGVVVGPLASGDCVKSFLGTRDGTTGSHGTFGAEGVLYTASGELQLGSDGSGGLPATPLEASVRVQPGELVYSISDTSGKHSFAGGNVEVRNELTVNRKSNFKGNVDLGGKNIETVNNITGSGQITGFNLVSARTVRGTSDERLKKNFVEIHSALDKILALNGYIFDWLDDEAAKALGTQIGVKAQEVQKVFPELVSEGDDGYLSVNYQGLVAPLIEAVKEQKELFDKQQTEINELKAQVKMLLKAQKK